MWAQIYTRISHISVCVHRFFHWRWYLPAGVSFRIPNLTVAGDKNHFKLTFFHSRNRLEWFSLAMESLPQGQKWLGVLLKSIKAVFLRGLKLIKWWLIIPTPEASRLYTPRHQRSNVLPNARRARATWEKLVSCEGGIQAKREPLMVTNVY